MQVELWTSTKDGIQRLREAEREVGRKQLRVLHDKEEGCHWAEEQARRCGCQHGVLAFHQQKAPGDSTGQRLILLPVSREERDLSG